MASLDEDLRRELKGYHRLRQWAWLAIVALIVIGFGIVAVLAYSQRKQIMNQETQIELQHKQLAATQMELSVEQKRLATSCAFFRDLSQAPLTPVPPVNRPSLLAVTIVLDARAAAIGRSCPGVPPASKELIHWAHYYHLPVP